MNSEKTKEIYLCEKLVKKLGGGYSSVMGINLTSMKSDELFKWFVVSMLFEPGISESVIIKTYRSLEQAEILTPEAVLETGWQGLVDIMNKSGYETYAVKTATKLLEITRALCREYDGDLNRLHFFAEDVGDLIEKLQGLGKDISPVTIMTFLKELRGIWEKLELPVPEPAILASRKLGLIRLTDMSSVLEELETVWEAAELHPLRFSDFEASLTKLGKNYCLKKNCARCPVKGDCKNEGNQEGAT